MRTFDFTEMDQRKSLAVTYKSSESMYDDE